MKKIIKNIEASIKAQLQSKAKKTGRPFIEVLQYYGMERFLYRLSRSKYANKFILKGALLFAVWQIGERRTTLDIDFLARFENHVEAVEAVIKDVCNISVEPDGVKFDLKTIQTRRIKEDADYEGVRVKFIGFLEKARITMQIDVAFGDVVYPRVRIIDYPSILDFPRPRLKAYPAESVISEKFEAMVKLGLLNSRMKDFYDIWLMIQQFEFKGRNLAEALKRTFNNRNTALSTTEKLFAEEIYDESSDRQILWRAFLRKGELNYAPDKLSMIANEIEKFLIEPITAINRGIKFNKVWRLDSGWNQQNG